MNIFFKIAAKIIAITCSKVYYYIKQLYNCTKTGIDNIE